MSEIDPGMRRSILNHIASSHPNQHTREFSRKWLEDENSPLTFSGSGILHSRVTPNHHINLKDTAQEYFDNLNNDEPEKSKHIITPYITRMMHENMLKATGHQTYPKLYKHTDHLPEALLHHPFDSEKGISIERT